MTRRKLAQKSWKRWAQKCGCFGNGNEATDPDDQHPVKHAINALNSGGTSVNPHGDGDVAGDTTNATATNDKAKYGRGICAPIKDEDEIPFNAANTQVESPGGFNVVGDTTLATETNDQAEDEPVICGPSKDEDEMSLGEVGTEVESRGDGDIVAITEDEMSYTSSNELILWETALRRIEKLKKDEKIIANIKNFKHELASENSQGGAKTSGKDIVQHLRKVIFDKHVDEEKNQWNIKFNDKEYSVRELFRNVFTILKCAIPIGDTLVSIDPVHAALPWAAVRLILVMLDAKEKLESDLVIGLAQVTKLVFQCDTYQQLYNSSNLPSKELINRLKEAIIEAYTKSLLFLGFAAHQLQGQRGFLAIPNILKLGTMDSHTQELLNVEKALDEAADDCEKCRSHQIQTTSEEILELAKNSYKTIEDQQENLRKMRESIFISKLHRVKAAEFKDYNVINEPRCHKDTRVELLQEIRNWVDNPEGQTVFWLEGMAGIGKSTISRTICQMFRDTGELGASFFFKRGDDDRAKPIYLFQTIVAQLCSVLPHFAQKLMGKGNENNISGNLNEQFRELIMTPLTSLKGKGRSTIVVVIDALDECGEKYQDVAIIVDSISKMKSLRPTFDFRFFLTSRSECYSRYARMTKETSPRRDVALHDIAGHVVKTDIRAYLVDELQQIRDHYNEKATQEYLTRLEDWPSENDLKQLVNLATPLFIFAATICRLLANLQRRPDHELIKILNQPTAKSNQKLSATYLPVLESLVPEDDDDLMEEIKVDFQEIVGSIVLLEKPLSILSLARLLQVEEDKVKGMINSLRSVIKVPPPSEPNSPITTFHLSFREFLVNENTENRGILEGFHIDMKTKHEILANKCLALLHKEGILKDDIYSLKRFRKERKSVLEDTMEKALPLDVQYAYLYWVQHLRKSNIKVNNGHRAYKFLRQYFLHWVEALILMGRISELIQLIRELQVMVDGTSGVQVLGFLRDAERFVLRFRTAIDIAPLQIYSSALLFAPHQSIVRRTFQDRHLGWAIQHPVVEDNWDPCLQTLEGHNGTVKCVAFSSDGTLIASGSDDGEIKVWKTRSGELQYTLEGHDGERIGRVVFSHDGKWIASRSSGDRMTGESDGDSLRIWDTMTGQLQKSFRDQDCWYPFVAFSSDSNLLVSVSGTHTIKVWNMKTWESCDYRVGNHPAHILSVASSSDRLLFTSGLHDDYYKGDKDDDDRDTFTVWDAETNKIRYTLRGGHEDPDLVTDVAFSSDGEQIALAFGGGRDTTTIKVWDTASGALQRIIDYGSGPNSVAFLSDSNLIASGLENSTLVIWDATNGAVHQTFQGHTSRICSISFSANFNLIASASEDKTIKLWDITKQTTQQNPASHSDSIRSLEFSADGKIMASASEDNTIKIWDAMDGTLRDTLKGHMGRIESITFSSDSKLLVSRSFDDVKIWDVIKGKLQLTLAGYTYSVHSVIFSPESKLLVTYSYDYTIKIWDAMEGKLQRTLEGHSGDIESIALSSDSKLLASASRDGTVKIWDPTQGTLQHTLKEYTYSAGSFNSVIFSADSKLLFTFYSDTIKIWDTMEGKLQWTLKGHERSIESIAFSSDSKLLASASWDGAIKIWDLTQGIIHQAFKVWEWPLSLSFSPTGSHLLVETNSSKREFDINSYGDKAKAEIERLTSHNFSLDESNSWVQRYGENLLWIPPEYRSARSECRVHPSQKRIGLGASSGRVIVIGFDEEIFTNSNFRNNNHLTSHA